MLGVADLGRTNAFADIRPAGVWIYEVDLFPAYVATFPLAEPTET